MWKVVTTHFLMTQAINLSPSTAQTTTPKIFYQVAMSRPESHLFEVTLYLENVAESVLNLKMPVWTPGSYLVREYARHLQDFSAKSHQEVLTSRKVSKNQWEVDTKDVSEVTVSYRVFANELTVRTNHLDSSHGYFNSAALLFDVVGLEQQPIEITIIPPQPEWKVTTPLRTVAGKENTFYAVDFDTLVDSPFEIGTHKVYDFEALGKPHQLAIWGEGNANPEQIITDTRKIIEVEADLFGGLPYDHYIFLLHLSGTGFGGLEHKNACSLNYPRYSFRAKDKYNRFMQLVAHEFFHLWNVKRIRPQALEKFDYNQEAYTTSLWFCEGTTSYYDAVIPLRADIYDQNTFLENISKDITRLQTIGGRKVQSLSESSFDAWIKLYRRDANSNNSQISYYLKGELVTFLLDLLIRAQHNNTRSLDDIMQKMWQGFGKEEIGFTPEQLRETIESVAGKDLTDFFNRYVDGLEELPFNEYLHPFGLELVAIPDPDAVPYLGIQVVTENGKEMIKFVESESPSAVGGIDAGDELLAIDGVKVSVGQLRDRVQDYAVGDKINVTVFHHDQLLTHQVQLGQPQPSRYEIKGVKSPSEKQKQHLEGWLGKLSK